MDNTERGRVLNRLYQEKGRQSSSSQSAHALHGANSLSGSSSQRDKNVPTYSGSSSQRDKNVPTYIVSGSSSQRDKNVSTNIARGSSSQRDKNVPDIVRGKSDKSQDKKNNLSENRRRLRNLIPAATVFANMQKPNPRRVLKVGVSGSREADRDLGKEIGEQFQIGGVKGTISPKRVDNTRSR